MPDNDTTETAAELNRIVLTEPGDESTTAAVDTARIAELLEKAKAASAAAEQARHDADNARKQVEEAQRQAGAALSEAQAKLAEVHGTATQALSASTKITDEQGVIASKSAHIEDAKLHADRVRADLDRALVTAEQKATEAEGLRARALSAADDATKLLIDVGTAKGAAEQTSDALKLELSSAKEYASQTKSLADKAEIVEKRVTDYEERLAQLENASKEQLKVIAGHLPGATSAGLASAFDKRKETFLKPHSGWQRIFVWSLIAIVVIAGSGLVHVYSAKTWPTWDEMFRLWVARVPVAGALVWLAMYASREAALAKRLEEDYGFKSAIASCFEGFRRQMSEIGPTVEADSPLGKLCENTLTTIANPPGRIYEKHELTISPTQELKQALEALKSLQRPD